MDNDNNNNNNNNDDDDDDNDDKDDDNNDIPTAPNQEVLFKKKHNGPLLTAGLAVYFC